MMVVETRCVECMTPFGDGSDRYSLGGYEPLCRACYLLRDDGRVWLTLRSPTVAQMRQSGVRDEHIEALLAEVWARGVTVTHGRDRTHVEWHAGTAVLPGRDGAETG